MKKLIILFLVIYNGCLFAQSPTVDTLRFKRGGKVWEVITYNSDSVRINGITYVMGGTSTSTNYWQSDGSSYIKPSPDTKIIKYPHIPYWNLGSSLQTDGPVWYKKSDNTLRGKILVPETIGGTQTATITCGDGPTYLYETKASDFIAYIGPIDSIPAPFTIKNLGEGSTVTVMSSEGLAFDSTAKTSLSLSYGDWVRFTPATTRFITESNLNASKYYTKEAADTVFVKSSQDSMYRYSIYSSGNENIEVLASSNTVTASVVGGTDVTLTIPKGVQLMSVKMRWENRSSFTVTVVNTGGATPSMSNRWMPNIAAWREDTGAQLKAVNSIMDISVYNKFLVNGLDNSTKCQVRLDL